MPKTQLLWRRAGLNRSIFTSSEKMTRRQSAVVQVLYLRANRSRSCLCLEVRSGFFGLTLNLNPAAMRALCIVLGCTVLPRDSCSRFFASAVEETRPVLNNSVKCCTSDAVKQCGRPNFGGGTSFNKFFRRRPTVDTLHPTALAINLVDLPVTSSAEICDSLAFERGFMLPQEAYVRWPTRGRRGVDYTHVGSELCTIVENDAKC